MRHALLVALAVLLSSPAQAGDPRRFLDAVQKLRTETSWQERMEATVVLGTSDDSRAHPHLVRALDDPHYAVRAAAIRALARIGDARAVPAILQRLADSDPFVRSEARKGMARFSLDSARPYLIAALRRNPDSRVRLAACERLAERPDGETLEVLLDATGDPPPVGRFAVSALSALPPEIATKAFLRGLDHQDYLVQIASIEALGELRAPAAVEPLIEELDARVPEVVLAATLALPKLREHIDRKKYTVNALRAEGRFTRARAIKVLGVLGDEDARRILRAALGDRDVVVRGAAVAAVGSLGDLEALPIIEQMRGQEENARILSSLKATLRKLRRIAEERGGSPATAASEARP